MIQSLLQLFENKEARAAGLIFALNSILFGSWITRIPEVKANLDMSEGILGLALLGLPLGALLSMPFTSWLVSRYGAGKVTFYSAVVYLLAVVWPVLAPNFISLLLALTLMGLGAGATDIAMNASIAAVERKDSISVMSTSHGLFSLGGMLGAGLAGLIIWLGISSFFHMLGMTLLMLVLLLAVRSHLVAIADHTASEATFALPSRALIGLAFISFCSMMGEGAIADWSGVYLEETLLSEGYLVGFGFAGFSLTMALGRFYGDQIIPKWGPRSIVRVGGLIIFVGLGLALVWPEPWIAILGFTLAGLGFSCLIPVVFGQAAKVPGMAPATSIAAVASLGYLGFLLGPPVIGFVADRFGLVAGLGLIVGMSILLVAGTYLSGPRPKV
ncbi:MAG: MFS transporter [Cyclobacteriaceae bacterium]